MIKSPIISIQNLTKTYRLYSNSTDRLKEVFWPWKIRHKLFYALQNVSFDVYRGEYIGIIGINGAGKSTLLQIITGVLTPSSGTIAINGRVAALLELGAGFNPELTGRENALFQLELAGLPRREIAKKIVELKEFAEIGEFFDQPMKIYSSGMFARVAFAASVLVDPDILIVDEALAVGDARFQKKCMDRMHRMKERGVSVLLVSHDVIGTKSESNRMILLDKGKIKAEGDPEEVTTQYFQMLYPSKSSDTKTLGKPDRAPRYSGSSCEREYIQTIKPNAVHGKWGFGGASLAEIRVYGLKRPNIFHPTHKLIFECDYTFNYEHLLNVSRNHEVQLEILVAIRMDNSKGVVLTNYASALYGSGCLDIDIYKDPTCTFRFTLSFPELSGGNYFFSPQMALGTKEKYVPIFSYENAVMLECKPQHEVHGLFRMPLKIERIY